MLFTQKDDTVLYPYPLRDPYHVFCFDKSCFISGCSLVVVDSFLQNLKSCFNRLQTSSKEDLFRMVSNVFMQYEELFVDDEPTTEYFYRTMHNCLVFSFCHFIVQATHDKDRTKPFMIIVFIDGYEVPFPLDKKKDFHITDQLMNDLKSIEKNREVIERVL